jgi:DNA (cytosine-5)-methyltransferase 1
VTTLHETLHSTAAESPNGHPLESGRVVRAPLTAYSELDSIHRQEHRRWRQRLLRQLMNAALVPSDEPIGDTTRPKTRVDRLSSELLTLTAALAERYRTPDLGNKTDPVEELVYIILSRRTREGAYQAAFDALKSTYPTWEALARAPAEEIERVVGFSGLGRRKAQSLKLALGALIDAFGRCTLDPTRAWSDERTLSFLCALPEVGPKSAACVMMCALDRPAFPVDAHVGRVLERLGTFRALGIELQGSDHKVKQRLLWDAVPPSLRYPLHVNLVVHGRAICLAGKPRCGDCVLAARCAYGSESILAPGDRSSRTAG